MQQRVIIHHLSDIHFGVFGSWPVGGKKSNNPIIQASGISFPDQYIQYLQSLKPGELPDIIIISGDVASIGSHNELEQAASFCQEVSTFINQTPTDNPEDVRIVVVPGNHDVDWSADQDHKLLSFREHFSQFHIPKKGYGKNQRSILVNEHLGLLIFAIDSTHFSGTKDSGIEDLKSKILQRIKSGDNKDIIGLFDEVDKIDPGVIIANDIRAFEAEYLALVKKYGNKINNFAKIAVLHHPVSLFPSEQVQKYPITVNGGLLKEVLQMKGFDLLLHGHLHHSRVFFEDLLPKESQQGIHIVAAGSLAGEAGEPNSFNIIEVKRKNGGQFICRVDKISSNRNQRFQDFATIGTLYRHDENVERLPKTFYHAIESGKNFESLSKELARLLDRAEKNTGYTSTWINIYETLLDNTERIYATDIQATDAWTTPIVYQYFIHQVRRLLAMCPNAGQPPFVSSEGVFNAIQISVRNIKSHLPLPQESELSIFSKYIDDVTVGNPLVEIVRILIWDINELGYSETDSIIRIHEAFGIPLFFLDKSKVDRGRFSEFEYIALCNKTLDRNTVQGFFYSPSDKSQEDDDPFLMGQIVKKLENHKSERIGYVLDDFFALLEREDILLAKDAQALYRADRLGSSR